MDEGDSATSVQTASESVAKLLRDHVREIFGSEEFKTKFEDCLKVFQEKLDHLENENRRYKISIEFLEKELKAATSNIKEGASTNCNNQATQVDELMFFDGKKPLDTSKMNGSVKRPLESPTVNGQPKKVLLAMPPNANQSYVISQNGTQNGGFIIFPNVQNGKQIQILGANSGQAAQLLANLAKNVSSTNGMPIRFTNGLMTTAGSQIALATRPVPTATSTTSLSTPVSTSMNRVILPKTIPLPVPTVLPTQTLPPQPTPPTKEPPMTNGTSSAKAAASGGKFEDDDDSDEVLEVAPPPPKTPEVVNLDDDDDEDDLSKTKLINEIDATQAECIKYHPLSSIPLPFAIEERLLPQPKLFVRSGRSKEGKKAIVLRMESTIDSSKIDGPLQYRIFNFHQNILQKPIDRAWKQLTVIKVQSGRICECTLTQLMVGVRYHFVVCLINGNNRSKFSNCATIVF